MSTYLVLPFTKTSDLSLDAVARELAEVNNVLDIYTNRKDDLKKELEARLNIHSSKRFKYRLAVTSPKLF